MLVYFFYGLPLLTVFIYGLKTPGCSWMLDWTLFFAGAMSQVVIKSLLFFICPKKARCTMESNIIPLLLLVFLSPDSVVPYRSISALPHSLHVQSPSRQMVACYHPQCSACCCSSSAGPALPHQRCLFYETCSQGTDQQREEEKLDRTPATDGRGTFQG